MLEQEGLVIRRLVNGKSHTFWIGAEQTAPKHTDSAIEPKIVQSHDNDACDWFWEGNVQAKVVAYLEARGFDVSFAADTASHQRGKDIVAGRSGQELWVTVKGYPVGTDRTNSSLQYSKDMCPRTLELLGRAVHLDVSPLLTNEDIEETIEGVNRVLDALA